VIRDDADLEIFGYGDRRRRALFLVPNKCEPAQSLKFNQDDALVQVNFRVNLVFLLVSAACQ
jgi:hypothetical protein